LNRNDLDTTALHDLGASVDRSAAPRSRNAQNPQTIPKDRNKHPPEKSPPEMRQESRNPGQMMQHTGKRKKPRKTHGKRQKREIAQKAPKKRSKNHTKQPKKHTEQRA
jgi:hypothetical protein